MQGSQVQGQDPLQRLSVLSWPGHLEIHFKHYRSTELQDTAVKLNSENISNITQIPTEAIL